MDWGAVTGIGSFLVAVAALLRPEWQSAIQKKRLAVDLYLGGRPEIGFFDSGPSLGLYGTIFTSGGRTIVRSIDVEVQNKNWNDPKVFSWAAFRSTNLLAQQGQLEVATAFSCPADTEKRLHLFLYDKEALQKIEPSLRAVRAQFLSYLAAYKSQERAELREMSAFLEFSKVNPGLVVNLIQLVSSAFYWDRGDYKMRVKIGTVDPERDFYHEYKFHLDDISVATLRENITRLVNTAILGRAIAPPNVVNVEVGSVSH